VRRGGHRLHGPARARVVSVLVRRADRAAYDVGALVSGGNTMAKNFQRSNRRTNQID